MLALEGSCLSAPATVSPNAHEGEPDVPTDWSLFYCYFEALLNQSIRVCYARAFAFHHGTLSSPSHFKAMVFASPIDKSTAVTFVASKNWLKSGLKSPSRSSP